MASIENSLKYESEVEPGKIRLITSGEFVRADATERVPPVGGVYGRDGVFGRDGARPSRGGRIPSLPSRTAVERRPYLASKSFKS